MKYSVAITSQANAALKAHLLRGDGQEDLCYALWYPGQGATRMTALLFDPILPIENERFVHGNASTTGEYLGRALEVAAARGAGIAFLHSHPSNGWQAMSADDIATERRQAKTVKAVLGMPLVGLTLGTDGAWSARFWEKTAPKTYERRWCESVRVVGADGLGVTFADNLLPPPRFREELSRTVSAWGENAQQTLARLKIGIGGGGSVGSVVAECLARIGVQAITLIDYDLVERHNLDRLLHAHSVDARRKSLKVDLIGAAVRRSATAANPTIERRAMAITEADGFKEALDCDLLFSCVDRPWPRHVLNYIAYAYLIPVIDGGILIRMRNGRLRQASWRNHVACPGKRCLLCMGQYDIDFVNLERRGDLDDPTYIENLPADHILKRNENVFPFSTHLAASLVLQALHVAIAPVGIADIGEHISHFTDGSIDTTHGAQCHPGCYFASVAGRGDAEGLPITGHDLRAEAIRQPNAQRPRRMWAWLRRVREHLSFL